MIDEDICSTVNGEMDLVPLLRRSIVIGIGRYGIESLLSSKKWVERNITAGNQCSARWIGIDTDVSCNHVKDERFIFKTEQSGRDLHGLNYIYSPLPAGISTGFLKDKYINDPCFKWLPNPDIFDIMADPEHGSGTRTLGRLAFFFNEEKIRDALINECDSLNEFSGSAGSSILADDDGNNERISVFISLSTIDCAGSGILFDIAVLVRDIFKDFSLEPFIYFVLQLPAASETGTKKRIMRANTYAFLKELDFFISGGAFKAEYPSGRKVDLSDGLFGDSAVYLLDIENIAGISLRCSDQVCKLAGQFIASFISSSTGAAVEKRVSISGVRSAYLPENELGQRKACYNSFGISRLIYPVPELKDAGCRLMALKVIDSFFKEVNWDLISETLGSIDRGLVRAIRFDSRMIFERIYPDYRTEIDSEMKLLRKKLDVVSDDSGNQFLTTLIKELVSSYSSNGLANMKYSKTARMRRRYRLDLEKIKGVIFSEVGNYISDPARGFNFARAIIDVLLDKLNIYQEKYCTERETLAKYPDEQMNALLELAEKSDSPGFEIAEAAVGMAEFNFCQFIYEMMLSSAESCIKELRYVLIGIKHQMINVLSERVTDLKNDLLKEIEAIRFNLFEKRNPLLLYLVEENEIEKFFLKFIFPFVSVEQLCGEINFVKIGEPDNTDQNIKTDKFREKIFNLINAGIDNCNFDNISILDILTERNISQGSILARLDNISRPYIYLNSYLANTTEYCCITSPFRFDKFDDEDETGKAAVTSLPGRMNKGKKGCLSNVIIFDKLGLCEPFEIISSGILAGFPLFEVNSLSSFAADYHALVYEEKYPLHVFNNSIFNAKYFPDPLRNMNCMDPAKLWSGLLLMKILEEYEGVYSFRKDVANVLRELEARENYKQVVVELERKIEGSGGFDNLRPDLLVEVISGLGILAKSTTDGMFQFRKEYSLVITDIIEGRGAGDPVLEINPLMEHNLERNIKIPKFGGSDELVVFLEKNSAVNRFLINAVKGIIERSIGNVIGGADITLPMWKIEQSQRPVFSGRNDFLEYFEIRGSIEWQNILVEFLEKELDDYIKSSRFSTENDPQQINKSKANDFLRNIGQRIPDVVIRDVVVKNCIV